MFRMGSRPARPIEWRLYGAEAVWQLHHQVEVDLPKLAAEALVEGLDSPSLVLLAGEERTAIQADLGELLVEVVLELGLVGPGEGEPAERVLRFRCWQIVAGEVRPLDAARSIERLAYVDRPPRAVPDFSLSDDPMHRRVDEDRTAIERRIYAAASKVLASPREPRRDRPG